MMLEVNGNAPTILTALDSFGAPSYRFLKGSPMKNRSPDRRAPNHGQTTKLLSNNGESVRSTLDAHDRCNTTGGPVRQRSEENSSHPTGLPGGEFGPLSREETLQFMLQRLACGVTLVTHEDSSLFAKLKAMFEIEAFLFGVLLTVITILVAAKLASAIPALVIAISCAAPFRVVRVRPVD